MSLKQIKGIYIVISRRILWYAIHIQRNTGVSIKLKYFKDADFQHQLRKILFWFSLVMNIWIIEYSWNKG